MAALAKIALILSLVAASSCKENEYKAPPLPKVTVAPPNIQQVTQYLEFTGTTGPSETVEIRARVEGVLLDISYDESEPLEVGEPMFRIDPAPFVAARDAAAAEVKASEASASLANTTATKLERAYADRSVSELQALEARAQYEVAVAKVEVAKKKLAIQELSLGYCDIAAPIAGRALMTDYNVGSLAGGPGSAALTSIIDNSKIHVWFWVPDRFVLQLIEDKKTQKDQKSMPKVELAREIDDGFPFTGRIDYFDPKVNESTGTLRMRATFDNANRQLVPGLFVRLRIAGDTIDKATIVPETSLASDQAGRHLLVVGKDDVVERRAIKLGALLPEGRVILNGIKAKDNVVIEGLMRARPGSKVIPETASSAK
jgi:membrane fusion protein, multidrug efflux system